MMRSHLIACLLLLTACVGGWDNHPLEPGEGELSGRFAGPVDPSRAWVAMAGHPELVASVSADGSFRFEKLAAGGWELAAVDGRGGAARRTVQAYAEREVSVALETAPELKIRGHLATKGGPLPEVTVRVDGLPIELATGGADAFELGAPAGCVDVTATAPGVEPATGRTCGAAGATVEVTLVLPIEPVNGNAGSCEPCAADDDCAEKTCVSGVSGERVCAHPCTRDDQCGAGLRCRESYGRRACLPSASCAALSAMSDGRACDEDRECGNGGFCVDHRCSVACEASRDCAAGLHCEPDEGEFYCH